MEKYRVKILNAIASEGLRFFDDHFMAGPDEEDPQGILVRSAHVDTSHYPSLLAVARAGAGVNNITVDKATGQGICVFNTPGANANAVAELVFIMLGIAARNIAEGMEFCRNLRGFSNDEISEKVEARKKNFRGFELSGKTLGVLGLGKIGIRVANIGLHHGMKVVGFDPFPALENIHDLSPEVLLARHANEVVRQADILTLHVPLNAKTRDFVDEKLLQQLPPGAILVNYARGAVVNEKAVLTALDEKRLSAYITDFPTATLLAHSGVIVTPHLGASTEESEGQCAAMAARALKAYLEYGNITHSVNFPTTESIPSGMAHTRLIMINRDVPGMIGFASQLLGSHGINIASYINESNGVIGYNIIDLEHPVSAEILDMVRAHSDVLRVRTIRLQGE